MKKTCRSLLVTMGVSMLLLEVTLAAHGRHQVPVLYRDVARSGGGMYLESLYLPPVTTGPWAPAWSPDGRQIAFAMQGSLWTVSVAGGPATQLTGSAFYDSEPNWSPDGEQVAFTRDTGEVIDIWVVNADGSRPRQVTHSEAFSLNPKWSPSGDSILYVTKGQGRRLNILKVSPDGQDPSAILSDDYQNISPSWSPDGREIVLVSNRPWNGRRIQGTGGIWTYRIGEAEPSILVPEETVWHAYPAWSPDGTKIAYGSFRTGDNQLFVLSARAGNPLRVTYVDGEIYGPAWSPDSQKIAYISNAGGQFKLYTIPVYGGQPEEVVITDLQHRYPTGHLKVVVREQSSGDVTAARVYVKASDGRGYAPRGEFHRMVVVTNDHYFQSDGSFTIELPIGPATIEAMKGFEYRPVTGRVEIREGQTQEVELGMERLLDMPSLGWHSGDNHIHMNYGGIFDATPTTLMNEAEAEDLHIINDLVANQAGVRIHDLKYFEGKLHALSNERRKLYYSEEYRPSFAGHMALLNLKTFFFPQFDGMTGTAVAANYPSNSQVLDAIHEQGGIGGYVHPYLRDPARNRYSGAREFPVNVALGNVDYFDLSCIWSDEYLGESVWYRTLNLGFRVPASAGSDAMSDYWRHPAIGSVRVYVKSGSPLNYGDWLRGLTDGRSFVTSGPLLFLRVAGREPGAEIRLPAGEPGTLAVEAEARSILPMQTLDIVRNGVVIQTVRPEDPHHVEVALDVPVERSGWIAARVTGPERQHLLMDSYVYAHTNPVYVNKGGQPASSPEDAAYFLKWVETVSKMIAEMDTFDTLAQKEQVLQVWRQAAKVYADLSKEGLAEKN